MIPILYAKNSASFETNGIGKIACISGEVTEERNGKFEAKLVVPENGLHVSAIEMDSILKIKPNQKSDLQLFRVYKITTPINGKKEIYAEHISYELRFVPVNPFEVAASPDACTTVLNNLKSLAIQTNRFDFWTDVQTVANFGFKKPISVRNALGGIEGSVLDRFGGEYEWDNFIVKLHRARGSTTPVMALRYGKNIVDLKQEENIAETITGVVPFWSSADAETVVMLPEKVVEIENAALFPFKRTVPMDLSTEFNEEPTENELRVTAQAYLNSSGIGIPKVSIKIKFADLEDAEEYENLQRLGLCDLVEVVFPKLQIKANAKVVKYSFDFISEKYNSIEVGSLRNNMATVINSTNKAIEATLDTALQGASEEAKKATSWLTSGNGYVVAVKNADGSWKELLFMNTPDTETATNVLRINENGIGFSTTGIDGPYRNAWTIDGHLLADFMDAGTLRGVTIIAGGVNNQSGTITAKNAAGNNIVIINQNGITVNAGTINGANISVGGVNNQSGTITMYNSSGNVSGWWNNAELNVGNGATILGASSIRTKWLDCADVGGEAWFPNAIYINRSGTGLIESRRFAVLTWNNQAGGIISAPQDGVVEFSGDIKASNFIDNSDRRLKQNIEKLGSRIEFIKKLKPVSFRMKNKPERLRHGFIAQEAKEAIDSNSEDWVFWSKLEDENETQQLSYMEIIADLVEVEQELLKRVERLEGEIDGNKNS